MNNLKQHSILNNIAIVGAGASGLLASIILGQAGFNVVVFDKNKKIGRKILATGNGKCNLSNKNISPCKFHTTNKEFLKYSLNNFDYTKLKKFFEDIGLELISEENGKTYPITLQSSSVVDILSYEASSLKVKFILDTKVKTIKYDKDSFCLSFNDTIQKFDKVIIASGSKAMSKLGSCDSGYDFAKSFGHTIVEPFASLVQLKSSNKFIQNLSGVKLKSKVILMVNNRQILDLNGDLLFTNYGISGNAILDISHKASYFLNSGDKVQVVLDIFPDFTKDELNLKLTKLLKNSKDKDKYFWLIGFIHKRMIKFVVDNCGISHNTSKASQLNKKDIIKLSYFLKNIKIDINDTNGLENAEVSGGGVDISQIDFKTMQSKLQNGLYFVGEVLDIDGQCGGYNLHWAFASGYTCAKAIQKELK